MGCTQPTHRKELLIKRTLTVILTLLLFISTALPANVFASEPTTIYPTTPAALFDASHEAQDESEVYTTLQNENARYGERTVATIIATETSTIKVKPSGQPSGGYCFPEGGSVNIVKGTGTPTTISIGLAWEWFSFSITPGTVRTGSTVDSISVNIPANNNYYHVYGEFEYEFNRVRVDEYQYTELINTYYKTTYRLISEKWYPQKVS